MALTATDTQGLEPYGIVSDTEVLYIPGTPGTTFTKGDPVTVTEGVVAAAGGDTAPLGVVHETVVVPAATQAFPLPRDFQPGGTEDKDLTLVGVIPLNAKGARKYKVSFANHADETVVSYSAASREIACTTGFALDDNPNGALVYVYEGPGAGEVNVVEDYDQTGGAVELDLVVRRPFNTTLTTASKFIVLAPAAANQSLYQLGRADLVSTSSAKIDVADGTDDGDFMAFFSWEQAGDLLGNLSVIVVEV